MSNKGSAMSQAHLEQRVGDLEREQVRQGERLSRIESDTSKTASNVEKLLDASASRGKPLDFKTAATVCGGLAAIAYVGWWLIGTSPAIEDLKSSFRDIEKRVSKLDDPEVGKVPRLQEDVRWLPSVRQGK